MAINVAAVQLRERITSKLNFYRDHPIMAVQELLEIDLPEAQRTIIRQTFSKSFMVISASRGFGKTFVAGVIALLVCILIPGSRVLLVGPTFRHAKLMFSEIERMLDRSAKARVWLKGDPIHQSDIWKMHFITNSIILAVPLAAESTASIRGIRAHLILCDEAPHIPSNTFNLVLTPMISTQRDPMIQVRRIEKMKQLIASGKAKPEELMALGTSNKLFAFTSAYYKFNHIYDKIQEFEKMKQERLDAGLKPLTYVDYFTYLDVPPGFMEMNAVEVSRRTSTSAHFRMEWLAEWQNDSGGFYPRRLIDSCQGDGKNSYFPELKGDRQHVYFMGIDPARTADNFAISIAKSDEGKFHLCQTLAFQNKDFRQEVLPAFRRLMREYPNIQAVYMDNGGGGKTFKDLVAGRDLLNAGEEPVLDMQDDAHKSRAGRRILKMIQFSPDYATDYNFSMKTEMEHGSMVFPLSAREGSLYIKAIEDELDPKDKAMVEIEKLFEEMTSIVITPTQSTGTLRFDAPDKNAKTDRFTSLLLCFAAYRDTVLKESTTIELPGGGWADSMASGAVDTLEAHQIMEHELPGGVAWQG